MPGGMTTVSWPLIDIVMEVKSRVNSMEVRLMVLQTKATSCTRAVKG